MFRLKRIEKLMAEFVEIERRVETIVNERKSQMDSERIIAGLPFACRKPGCDVSWHHVHVITDNSQASGSGDTHE